MYVNLVTWLGTGNYGTTLQSYALHEILKEMDYNVRFVHSFSPENFSLKKRLFFHLKIVVKETLKQFERTSKDKKIRSFNKENYNHVHIHTEQQYRSLLKESDVFITGSDQIWNCYHNFDPFMFLAYAGSCKRVAYASSIGTSDIPQAYIERVKYLLNKFTHIGVREGGTANFLNTLLGRNDVRQVLDPTFLLSSSKWLSFAKKSQLSLTLPQNYILCYFIGNRVEYALQLEDVKRITGMSNVILIPSLENNTILINETAKCQDAGPYEFVELVAQSSLVCTDSFHACALSINLSKDFVAFKRFSDNDKRSQNSRIYDLLCLFGLSNRLYNGANKSLKEPIDYFSVQKILQDRRAVSIDFLKGSIEN